VVEAKCWPSYQGRLKKLSISTLKNLKKMKGSSSIIRRLCTYLDKDFLERYEFEGKKVSGKLLAWWDVEDSEVEEVKRETGLSNVISIKKVLEEDVEAFRLKLEEYRRWIDELFDSIQRKED